MTNIAYYYKEIKSILERNSYQVSITKIRNRIIIKYPKRVEQPCNMGAASEFYIRKNKLYMIATTNGKVIFNNVICELPYAYKAVIFAHIMKVCFNIFYHTEFVRFFAGKQELTEEEFIKLPFTKLKKQDTMLERALIALIPKMFNNENDVQDIAKELGILDGCLFIQENVLGITNDRKLTNGK